MSLPSFPAFVVQGEEGSAGIRWKKWIDKLENMLCGLDVTADDRKKALLLHYAGDEVYEIFDNFSDDQKGVDAVTGADNTPNTYQVAKKSQTDYFTPKQNVAYDTFKFRGTIQQPSETIDAYITRLKTIAHRCDFHDVDREILGQLVQGCSSSKVRQIFHSTQIDDESTVDEDYDNPYYSSDEVVFSISNPKSKSLSVEVHIFNKPVPLLIDTGASVSLMTFDTYKKVCPKAPLYGPCPLIFAYGSDVPLPIIGFVTTDVNYNDQRIPAKFYVVNNNKVNKANNLMSLDMAETLGLVHFTFALSPDDKFHTLFSNGVGKIKDISIKLHIDQSVRPVAQRHRRIPFHVRKDVEAELNRLEKLDIIEKIEGPTPWVSPVVVVPKKQGVRLCIDMREANKAIKREKHIMPTLDDLIADLNGSTVFSKLDMSNAYHQLELDPESRYITTFSTHVGLRRYKRLLFGVNAAAEIFQNAIAELLADIPGAKNLSDDIIIHGKTQAEHDVALQATLQQLQNHGAKLNREKCVFSVSELTFFGHIFGKKGVAASPDKVSTIINSPPPTNVSEVRSLLGMTQYVARFIANYATITEPLRNLTKKDAPWEWSEKEQQAFNCLKETLTNAKVMSYFDQRKPTKILVDASPVGLGAILTQEGKIICYASRALTPTEQRYSQTDREMLAVVYGVEHFHLYLYGSSFTVVTDHKPLLGIVNSQKPTTARIERWRLRLMPYEMSLTYAPGRDDLNPADYISRHPQSTPQRENKGEEYINYVAENAVPVAMTKHEVRIETQRDDQLQKVMRAIQTGQWQDGDVSDFARFSEELSMHDGLILRGHRLVIPKTLRQKVINIAHQAHQGIVKTKQCLREKVWFPRIDTMVEETVKSCIPCQASYPGPKAREPIISTPLPSEPWSALALDFAGPFPSGDYLLVVIDEYSRFPEVEIISSTSAKIVTRKLETIFSRQGIPKTVKTDNGPPFHGQEFSHFATQFGFHHRKITPLWPEANGEAERFMRTLDQNIRSSTAANLNWKTQLPTFLRQYRGTPHSSTGVSPFEALTKRKMNIGLPDCSLPLDPIPVHTRMIHNDFLSKRKMTEFTDRKRHTQLCDINPGDHVLVKQKKLNKLSTPYSPLPYVVIKKKGSMLTAQRGNHSIVRNSSHFKPIQGDHTVNNDVEEKEDDDEEEDGEAEAQAFPYTSQTRKLPVQPNSPTNRPVSPAHSPRRPTAMFHTPTTARVPNTSPRHSQPAMTPAQPDRPDASPPVRPQRQRHAPTYLEDYER
ncbi:hypothetical protein V1264_003469 [Littorina saxatilis]|uniref:Reverse transcriptase n=1 Tax=Littorina saxatilis TaxID=31220 RepID=A0AAN9G8B7_9CAEN